LANPTNKRRSQIPVFWSSDQGKKDESEKNHPTDPDSRGENV
jgi:hypothetical protein